jgi:hypothetical protein
LSSRRVERRHRASSGEGGDVGLATATGRREVAKAGRLTLGTRRRWLEQPPKANVEGERAHLRLAA